MHTLDDFVGQADLKDFLRPKIQLARANGLPLPHLLFCGEKELGKLSFASGVAKELGGGLTVLRARDLSKPLDLTGALANLLPRAVLAITDVDSLGSEVLDLLTQAVSAFQVPIRVGLEGKAHTLPMPPFTLIGTTRKPWLVDESLRRWCIPCQFAPYTLDQGAQVAQQIGHDRGLSFDEAVASEIAAQCHLKPGEISVFLQRVANHLSLGRSCRIDAASLSLINEVLGEREIEAGRSGTPPGEYASMKEGTCNKCGERKELVLAGSVCGGCSAALDERWANSQATDWVLIAAARTPTADVIEELKLSLAKKAGKPYARLLAGPGRWVYRNTTYEQVKSHWATVSESQPPPGDWHPLSGGATGRGEAAHMRSLRQSDTPSIRPATAAEIADDDQRMKDEARGRVIAQTFEEWGFDNGGEPLDGVEDDSTRQRLKKANAEIGERLERLGLQYSDEALRAICKRQAEWEAFRRTTEVIQPVFKKWGLDEVGRPLGGTGDRDVSRRKGQAAEEIAARLEQLGLTAAFDETEPAGFSPYAFHELSSEIEAARLRRAASRWRPS